MLSLLELIGLGLEKEEFKTINFNPAEIIDISSFEEEEAIVTLKIPPFKNIEDFHLICKTKDLLNSNIIMDVIIDRILNEIRSNGFYSFHKDLPKEEVHAVNLMQAENLIKLEGTRLKLKKKGMKALKSGGYRNFVENHQNEKTGGDTYYVNQAGSVGPNSSANNITFNQLNYNVPDNLDYDSLGNQLSKLKEKLSQSANTPDEYLAISEVAKSEEAAKENDGNKVVKHLLSGGKWVFETAKEIGVDIITSLIKKQMDM
ncbi:MAG: hypothetical protein HKN86_04345 [Acidimicrobiia bacterium]|nr:hypothetical protein [Acidimicrobiia bacterium]